MRTKATKATPQTGPYRGIQDLNARLTPESAREILPMKEIKRLYAERALELCGGNYTAAAKVLGVAANTLRGFLAGR